MQSPKPPQNAPLGPTNANLHSTTECDRDEPSRFASAAQSGDSRLSSGWTCLAGRYRLESQVGRGATGTVYSAVDQAHGQQRVAIKLLFDARPHALVRLKNEFRSLSGLRHPNLVSLHGLGVDRGQWFVVMDLVEGASDFLRYIRSQGEPRHTEPLLRSLLAQLLCGVERLHAAGKVHRDLKPSNVLIDRSGKLVIVDFGLLGDEQEGGVGRTHDGCFVGTPAYCAPEQVLGSGANPKADLYAVGTMLFEALTGRLPFGPLEGTALLRAKADTTVRSVRTWAADVPRDLTDLCDALLQPDPASRPTAASALATLQHGATPVLRYEQPHFEARSAELQALHDASVRARTEGPLLALVLGEGGIGKTSLLTHFAEAAQHSYGALVLSGRCYVEEHVPFKGFDALIDALGRYLAGLSTAEAALLMPREVEPLVRLFPTLLRVDVVARIPPSELVEHDGARLRARAFGALKEMLARIADHRSLVLCLDDVQWCDDDSVELLRALLSGPFSPRCLVTCALRSDGQAAELVLSALRAMYGVTRIEVPLSRLDPQTSSTLAAALMAEHPGHERVQTIVRESRGIPYWIHALARESTGRDHGVGVAEATGRQLERLSREGRALIELLSTAGYPLEATVAQRALDLASLPIPEVLASSLVCLTQADGREQLHTVHDLVRESVTSLLATARVSELHGILADTLLSVNAAPEQIAEHLRAAGRFADARPQLLRAAALASAALAFSRAAALYELVLLECPSEHDGDVQETLAEAYAHLGRLSLASAHYERAVDAQTDSLRRHRLLALAMMLRMLCGDTERGDRLLVASCRELGVPPMPKKPWLFAFALGLLLLRLLVARRIGALPRPEDERHDAHSRARLELLRRATQGAAHFSMRYGLYFGLQMLIATRRLRDRKHWPIAVAWDVAYRTSRRGVSEARDDRAMTEAIRAAESCGDDEVLALVLSADGGRQVYTCRFAEGAASYERAERLLATRGLTLAAVHNSARSGRYSVWFCRGDMRQIIAHHEEWLRGARASGDPWSELIIRVMGSVGFLALDDPEAAYRSLEVLQTSLGRQTMFGADPWWFGEPALYQGDLARAQHAIAEARTSAFFGAVQHSSSHRVWFALFEARVHLACAAAGASATHLRRATRLARQLRSERSPVGVAASAHVHGLVALQRGRSELARTCLERSVAAYDSLGIALHAASVRDSLGRVVHGHAGDELRARAHAEALVLGVRRPERWFRSLCPTEG